MRSLKFLFGCLLGACTTAAPASAPLPDYRRAAEDVSAKTVALVGVREDGSVRVYCSGVWISENKILTAAHCLADKEIGGSVDYLVREDVFDAYAESADMRPRGARVVGLDPDHDLGVLVALRAPSGHGEASMHVGVQQGQFAQAMGHSLGLWYSYSTGVVSAVREKDLGEGPMIWIQSTVAVSPGNSGGGLFAEDGSLLGICHGSFTKGQALNLFVPVAYARPLVEGT